MEISIIVSNYNGSKYINQCINSLLAQEINVPYEVIVIDDCSTDSSWDYLKTIKNSKFVLIKNEQNIGVSASRNRGISISKGKYICFTDSDDYVEPDYLISLFNGINQTDVDLAVVPFYGYFGESSTLKLEIEDVGLFNANEIIIKLLKFRFSSVVWNKIYKKDILSQNQIAFKEGLYNEDILFNYEYLKHCNRINILNNPVYYYRIHGESLTGGLNKPLLNDMITIYYYIKEDRYTETLKDLQLHKYFAIRLVIVIGLKRVLKKWPHSRKELFTINEFVRDQINFGDVLLEGLTLKEKCIIFLMKLISKF